MIAKIGAIVHTVMSMADDVPILGHALKMTTKSFKLAKKLKGLFSDLDKQLANRLTNSAVLKVVGMEYSLMLDKLLSVYRLKCFSDKFVLQTEAPLPSPTDDDLTHYDKKSDLSERRMRQLVRDREATGASKAAAGIKKLVSGTLGQGHLRQGGGLLSQVHESLDVQGHETVYKEEE